MQSRASFAQVFGICFEASDFLPLRKARVLQSGTKLFCKNFVQRYLKLIVLFILTIVILVL